MIFALTAFALRAILPAGYMMSPDPDTGEVGIYLCQQSGNGLPADWVNPFEPEQHHPDEPEQHHPDQDQSSPGCAFALAGTPLTPDAPTIVAVDQGYTVLAAMPVDRLAPRPAAFNPTARPRAPPSLSI